MTRLARAVIWVVSLSLVMSTGVLAQERTVRRAFSSTAAATPEAVRLTGTLPAAGSLALDVFPIRPTGEETAPLSAFYAFTGQPANAMLTLVAHSERSLFVVSVYDDRGAPIQASDAASSELRLFLSGGGSGLIEVTLVNPRSEDSGGFTLSLTRAEALAAELGNGHAHRRAITSDVYQDLVAIGRCNPLAGGPCDDSANRCDSPARRFFNAIVAAPDFTRSSEPIVAFLGVAGLNRIGLLDCSKRQPRPLTFTSLGQARDFWVVYVEDSLAPFRTSIDVEFKGRVASGDHDEYDPAGLVSVGAVRGNPGDVRIVRVGVRRFHVRRPPVEIEVTFSRQGSAYGLRQWRRAYKVYAWGRTFLTGGVFVPATEILVDQHDVVERQPGASDALPFDSVIVKEQTHRQLFVYASAVWTQRRAHVDNAVTSGEFWRWVLMPEFVGGLGLPAGGKPSVYLGGGWPVWGRLSLTGGAVLTWQNKLSPGYHVGQRVPLGTNPDALTYRGVTTTLTFGGAIDLLNGR